MSLVLVLPLLALAPFFCTDAGPGWPSSLRDRLLLVLAWSGAATLMWTEPGLGLFAAVVLCHWRGREGVGAVVTVGAGVAVFLAARTLPSDLIPFVTWIIVLTVAGQVGLAMIQTLLAILAGQNWHVVREAARGTVGNRVVLGCLCAMAWPLATIWWIAPILFGLALTRSFSALVSAAVAAIVLWPALWWVVGLVGVLEQLHRLAIAHPPLGTPEERARAESEEAVSPARPAHLPEAEYRQHQPRVHPGDRRRASVLHPHPSQHPQPSHQPPKRRPQDHRCDCRSH